MITSNPIPDLYRNMKNEHAQKLGSLGGKATASKMTPEERKERSAKAIQKRWENYRSLKEKSLKYLSTV